MNDRFKIVLIVGGTISLILGIIGIFLPILPTTPFLLLAAFCYARSSQRFHNWLMGNKYLGTYIKSYMDKKGIPLRVKIFSIVVLWITIGISIILISNSLVWQIILTVIAAAVTVHVLSLKTLK
ncbi:MAG: YbaN family protein [Dehalococcoidia bacterium]|nr:YbaN family protein [Dehalococcoidia bacterium]MDD5494091.1 YbaN family protein [Dehalococcoidia bacterium]